MEQLNQNNVFRHPLISILFTLLVIFFVGFQIIGVFAGYFLGFAFFPGDAMEYLHAFENPTQSQYPEFRTSLLVTQGVGAFLGMVVAPYYFLRKQQRSLKDFFQTPYLPPALIVPILVIVFMGFNGAIIKWNQEIYLPFGMDEWARPMEERLMETTKYMMQFDSTAQLIIGFLVIAVIPAIGEEIIFRGMIQNDFYRATRNIHLSIWVSALLFSAIHIQFFGFFPRLLLGALFGYLYYWSGNLLMPVLAHFINNGFTVATLVLTQKKAISIDLEKIEPSATQIIVSAVFSGILLYAYKNFFNKLPKSDIPD
jgi:uncharacterized protein